MKGEVPEVLSTNDKLQSTGRVVVLVGDRDAKAHVFAMENVRFVSTNDKVLITKYRKGGCFGRRA